MAEKWPARKAAKKLFICLEKNYSIEPRPRVRSCWVVVRFRGVATRYKKTARMYVALIILILVYLVTKIGKSALRVVHIGRTNSPTTSVEIYVPQNLRDEYERSLFQRRVDFDWFSPPNK